MKNRKKIDLRTTIKVLFIVLLFVNCTKRSEAVEEPDVTSPVDTTSAKVWKQEKFVLSSFHALNYNQAKYKDAFSLNKEAGIDLVELTFLSTENVDAAVRVAEEVGIKVMAQDLAVFSGFQGDIPSFTENTVLNRINSLKGYKMLDSYYVWDEPYEKDFATVRRLRDMFKKHDPARLAFSVLFPSYGIYKWDDGSYPRYVDNYLRIVDPEVLSFDYYPFNNNSESLINSILWKDMGYHRKKALEYEKPFWFYFQAVSVVPGEVNMNLQRIRAQMYAALAYGVKGLSYYYTSNDGALLDADYNKTPMYNDLKALNASVKNVGALLFNKKSEQIYQTQVKNSDNPYSLDNFQDAVLFKSAPDNLVVGVFGDAGNKKYVLITNLSHTEEISGQVELRKSMKISEFDKKDNIEKPVSDAAALINIKLSAGEAQLFILQ